MSKGRFKVGDHVIISVGPFRRPARVIEDRGCIGVNGRRLLRVEVMGQDVGDPPPSFEVAELELEPAAA